MTNQTARERLSSFAGRLAAVGGFDRDDFAAIDHAIAALADSPSVPPSGPATRRKLYLCMGTNYEGQDRLGGCINDLIEWTTMFRQCGFTGHTLAGRAATRSKMVECLRAIVAEPNADIVIQFSGHGTQVPDRSGDESDCRDEAICPNDFRSAGVIVDDELDEIFGSLAAGSRLVVILDCCHSGTAVRDAANTKKRSVAWEESIPRRAKNQFVRGGIDQSRTTLLAACRDDETAADTGKSGAFTDAMLATFDRGGTASAWVTRAGAMLAGQHPRLLGADFDVAKFFGG